MSEQGRIFVGVLGREKELRPPVAADLIAGLENALGPVECGGGLIDGWVGPRSYREETGQDLNSAVFTLPDLYYEVSLGAIKRQTMALESALACGSKRRFNINPGFVGSSGMCLVSHKPSALRYPLGAGVWVEHQFDASYGKLIPRANAFDEYLDPARIELLEKLMESVAQRAA